MKADRIRVNIRIALLLVAMLSGPAAVLFSPAALLQAASNEADRPNVLFIAIDDLNDWVGVLETNPQVRTPHLDRLASRGVTFHRAYCAAPGCNASRAALLTGRAPHNTGVYHNPHDWRKAMPDVVTLPQHFKANGYYVAGGGKVFHSDYHDPPSWHDYYHEPGQGPPPGWPLHGIEKLTNHLWFNDWGPLDAPDEEMTDMHTAAWACGQLRQPHDKPFFLAVGFHRPHTPWYAPRKYFDMYPLDKVNLPPVRENDLDDVPRIGRSWAAPWKYHEPIIEAGQWKEAVQAYLACITFVDACVGKVMAALDNSPHADNTIVVLWSDHGYHLGEKKVWGKFALWEKTTRNPLMMIVPDVTRPDQHCRRPVSLLDIYPTLVELCQVAPRAGLDGTTLVPLLKDPGYANHPLPVTTNGRGHHAVRSDRWRYIHYNDGTEELYDEKNDPHEWTNLAGDPRFDDVKKELAAHLPERSVPDAPRKKQPNLARPPTKGKK